MQLAAAAAALRPRACTRRAAARAAPAAGKDTTAAAGGRCGCAQMVEPTARSSRCPCNRGDTRMPRRRPGHWRRCRNPSLQARLCGGEAARPPGVDHYPWQGRRCSRAWRAMSAGATPGLRRRGTDGP
eukprot:351853-Chlamydomonas_euryale.AAC.6